MVEERAPASVSKPHIASPAHGVEIGGCCSLWSPYVPLRLSSAHGRFTRPLWLRPTNLVFELSTDSCHCLTRTFVRERIDPCQHSSTSTPTPRTRCRLGVAELHGVIDRLHVAPYLREPTGDRPWRRWTARSVGSSRSSSGWSPPLTRSGLPGPPGSPGPTRGSPRRRPCPAQAPPVRSRSRPSWTSGHDATAAALDAGLVSPGHAAVIVTPPGNCLTRSVRSSARSSKHTWSRRPPGSAPTSSAGSRAGRSRPSNPTRPSWTPTRTSWSAPRNRRRRTSAHSPCMTTGTAPPPGTSPSPRWPPASWPR